MKIYIVEGQTGEYADSRNWPVKAFNSQRQAKNFTAKLNARAKALGVSERFDWSKRDVVLPQMKELDPSVSIDYTGVSYNFYELDLE